MNRESCEKNQNPQDKPRIGKPGGIGKGPQLEEKYTVDETVDGIKKQGGTNHCYRKGFPAMMHLCRENKGSVNIMEFPDKKKNPAPADSLPEYPCTDGNSKSGGNLHQHPGRQGVHPGSPAFTGEFAIRGADKE